MTSCVGEGAEFGKVTDMKALVTGGAGFVGSHLVERLLADGCEVLVLDDLSTGSVDNLGKVKGDGRFRFVEGSVRDGAVVGELVEQCEVVFHLAAAVGVELIVKQPVRTIETNIHGTEIVLEQAAKFGRKVLITSSSEVYGKSQKVPFGEDDDMVLGSTRFSRWSYACSKAIDEFLGLAYHQQFGLEVVIVRLFNTIGPRQRGSYGMVVPRFVGWALKDEPIRIYGDGTQTRCFGYVGDVVDALVKLSVSSAAVGGIFNIGGDEEISIIDLADKIIGLTGSRSVKEFVSYEEAYGRPFDDMMRRVPCRDRLRGVIGYEPGTGLDEMLRTIIESMGGR